MFLAARSIRLLVIIMIALLIGWKVRQHRIATLPALPVPTADSSNAFTGEVQPGFPDE